MSAWKAIREIIAIEMLRVTFKIMPDGEFKTDFAGTIAPFYARRLAKPERQQ